MSDRRTLTSEDHEDICRTVCPHCKDGHVARQRPDTKEWQHQMGGGAMTITICWANGLRNSEKWKPGQ